MAWVWVPVTARVDDAKGRALLTERGPTKDKRAMPFVQLFKVRSRKQNHLFSLRVRVLLIWLERIYRKVLQCLEPRWHSSARCCS